MNECVRRVGVQGRQRKEKIRAQRQNIWLPGNWASSNGSNEEWWCMSRRPRSGFRTVSGRGGGQRQGNVSTCPDLSGPVNNDTLSLGARPWHIDMGLQTGLRFKGLLLVSGSIQVIYAACNPKMSSLHCLITRT